MSVAYVLGDTCSEYAHGALAWQTVLQLWAVFVVQATYFVKVQFHHPAQYPRYTFHWG